jgi:hypoxanthine-guanine phosphoribosyltransferase
MKNRKYTWDGVQEAISSIAMQMFKDEWRPDYIVGITRGGLIPAVLLSHVTDIPMHTLCVQLESEGLDANTESNTWMAEEALIEKKKILIIDDINRGGDAISWIMNDWQLSVPGISSGDAVWHNNIRFASLIDNPNSKVPMDYCNDEIDLDEEGIWVEFPWEN